jgi:hypothetical protein
MSVNTVCRLLVFVLFAAPACDSTDTRSTGTASQIMAPTPNPIPRTPTSPNPPGPLFPLPFPTPNPPGPMPSPAQPAPNPPAPNPSGPTPTVRTPGFLMTGAPFQRSIVRGGQVTFIVSLRSVNGFRGEVTMSARILPANELWNGSSWSPQPVTLAPGGTATSTLTIVTNRATPAGAQAITVEGTAGEIQETANLLLTVR